MSTIISRLEEIKLFVKDDEDYYIDEQINTQARTFLEKLGVIKNYIGKLKIHDEDEDDRITEEKDILNNLVNLIPSIHTNPNLAPKYKIYKEYDPEAARKKEADDKKSLKRKAKKEEREQREQREREQREQRQREREQEQREREQEREQRERVQAQEREQEREREQREQAQERERKAKEAKKKEEDKKREEEAKKKEEEAAAKQREEERKLKEKEAAVLQKITAAKEQTEQNKTKANKLLIKVQKDIDFENEFTTFQTNIQEASSIKNANDNLKKADEYKTNIIKDLDNFKKESDGITTLQHIKDQINEEITRKKTNIDVAYNAFGFQNLATVRIAELKIKEEERKLWSTEGFNENFQRIWGTDFKQEFEKDRWKALDPEKRKSLINKIKEFVDFFNICDNNLERIINKIESFKKKMSNTLSFFNTLKYIYGSAIPTDESGRGMSASDMSKKQNNFLSKLLLFFGKINTTDETTIRIKLPSITITPVFSIDVAKFVIWLNDILQSLISCTTTIDNFNTIWTEIATDTKQDVLCGKIIKNFPLTTFKKEKFILLQLPDITFTTPILPPGSIQIIKNQFLIASFQKALENMISECKQLSSSMRGGTTKKLKRKQIFSKTHKNIYPHNNGTANRFYRGQHRSRKNHHIHQITVRKY